MATLRSRSDEPHDEVKDTLERLREYNLDLEECVRLFTDRTSYRNKNRDMNKVIKMKRTKKQQAKAGQNVTVFGGNPETDFVDERLGSASDMDGYLPPLLVKRQPEVPKESNPEHPDDDASDSSYVPDEELMTG